MIRLRRAPEPEELRHQRVVRLTEALLWPPAVGLPDTNEGYGDPSIRKALAEDTQHGLCAFYGAPIDTSGSTIDHFRPRAHYWWLTWSWDNLWITCNICQQKSDEFEIEIDEHSQQLMAPTIDHVDEAFETSRENALLLDPAVDDPAQHLCVEPDSHGMWWWAPVPGSRRGLHTWKSLRLGRFDTSDDQVTFKRSCTYDRLNEHLDRRVEPRCKDVLQAIDMGDESHALTLWESLCRESLYRRSEHLVPTWWYLHRFHTNHGLSTHGMSMPSYPDDHPEAIPQRGFLPWPADLPHGSFDARTQLLVRHTRNTKKASIERVREAIVAVCRQEPRTDAAICELLGRAHDTIKNYTKALCESGQLSRIEGQDPPRYRV